MITEIEQQIITIMLQYKLIDHILIVIPIHVCNMYVCGWIYFWGSVNGKLINSVSLIAQ